MHEDWIRAIVLGIVQGITEFLPISSSGHLTILQYLLGLREPQLLLDVVLHSGTLGALLVVFRKDIWQIIRGSLEYRSVPPERFQPTPRNVIVHVGLGTVVTGIVGVGLHDSIESLYSGIGVLGPSWIVTGTVLWTTRWVAGGSSENISVAGAVVVGLAQAFALLPGISRSGVTIAAALLMGWNRRWAATFSFLLAIPATVGALLLESLRGSVPLSEIGLLVIAGGTSLVVGWISLRWLVNMVLKGYLYRFAWYCWAMGGVVTVCWILS